MTSDVTSNSKDSATGQDNLLESDRLTYRLFDQDDGELLFYLDQDPEVMRFLNGGQPTPRDQIDQVFVPRMMRYRNPEKGWGIWGVFAKEAPSNLPVGWILARPMCFFTDEETQYDDLELGWRFARNTWGKGFATEAARTIEQYVLGLADYTKVSALAAVDNVASIAVMKRLGMTFQKRGFHRDEVFEAETVFYSKTIKKGP